MLSGAVLTSYVGVTGLVRRMTVDSCLPQFLLVENRWRGTNHWIIASFFFVCVSILVITGGDVATLAGVYTISFLSVMALFATGNMLLKAKRARLPRAVRASWPAVIVALVSVLVGLVGNILMNPVYVGIFTVYFVAAGSAVAVMLLRVSLLKAALFVSRAMLERVSAFNEAVRGVVLSAMDGINNRAVIYFSRGDAPEELNRAALYVLENEQTNRLKVVHVYQDSSPIPPGLAQHLADIDRLYPRLRIDFIAVKGEFGPALIGQLSQRLGVPRNYMFIGTPGDKFPHRIELLGGVRVIL